MAAGRTSPAVWSLVSRVLWAVLLLVLLLQPAEGRKGGHKNKWDRAVRDKTKECRENQVGVPHLLICLMICASASAPPPALSYWVFKREFPHDKWADATK